MRKRGKKRRSQKWVQFYVPFGTFVYVSKEKKRKRRKKRKKEKEGQKTEPVLVFSLIEMNGRLVDGKEGKRNRFDGFPP